MFGHVGDIHLQYHLVYLPMFMVDQLYIVGLAEFVAVSLHCLWVPPQLCTVTPKLFGGRLAQLGRDKDDARMFL